VTGLDGFLLGDWQVQRDVHDAQLGDGRFEGTATFARRDGGLTWHEHGRLRLARYDGPGRRDLLLDRDGAGWQVRFADGRPFHRLELTDGTCAVEHRCGRDVYAGAYAVTGRDSFEVRWRVRGPAKDQRLIARYERG
jgi:Family of unknown function (DUF6314)